MKRIAGLLMLVVVLVTMAGEALAQDTPYLRIPHRFTISLDAGIGIPTAPSEFKRSWNTTLPINIAFGVAVFSWFDLNLQYSHAGFGLNTLEANRQINFEGNNSVEGGGISTTRYTVNSRFIAVPSQRANPFVEIALGTFTTKTENVVVDGTRVNTREPVTFVNTTENVSGVTATVGAGIQYVLNESWSAYTKFDWTFNLNGDFAPSELLLNQDIDEESSGPEGNQEFASLLVGLMVRF